MASSPRWHGDEGEEETKFSLNVAATRAAASLAGREISVGEDHVSNLQPMRKLALLKRCQGDLDAAAELYERELSIVRAMVGNDHPDAAASMRRLGILYGLRAETRSKAVPLLEDALRIERSKFGEGSEEVAHTTDALAVVAAAEGRFEAARDLERASLQSRYAMAEARGERRRASLSATPLSAEEEEDDYDSGEASESDDAVVDEFKPVVWNVLL